MLNIFEKIASFVQKIIFVFKVDIVGFLVDENHWFITHFVTSFLGIAGKNLELSQHLVDALVMENFQCRCFHALFNDSCILQQTLGKYSFF